MKKYLVIFLMIICPLLVQGQVQNLDRLSQAQRDSILVAIAKDAILKYGPDYYDEVKSTPVITRYVVTKEDEEIGLSSGYRAGRIRYNVGYLREKEYRERCPWCNPYLVIISIWEDTGLLSGVMFGGMGLSFRSEADLNIEEHPIFVRPAQNEGQHSMRRSEFEQRQRERERERKRQIEEEKEREENKNRER